MNLIAKAKAHPWMTGALIIGGGLVFFVLSGWFTGGSSGSSVQYVDDGPSDAEIGANAAIAAAQIQAGAAAGDTAASLALAKMQLEYQSHSDELGYDLGIKQLDYGAQVSLAQIQAQLSGAQLQANVINSQTAASTQISQATINAQRDIALDNNKTQLGLVQSIIGMNNVDTGPTTSNTPAVVAPPKPNISDFLASNPDLAQEGSKQVSNGTFGSIPEYLVWHESYFGTEGRGQVGDYL